ncbi:MAG: SDR family NAD(P)-dependent oxidoreductase [Sphingomonadaceae bacterium]
MRELKGAGIIITGGGSGLGEATARWLVDKGAKVTITGRREDKIQHVAANLGCNGVAGDITREGDRKKILDAALHHAGRLDALVNNAGNMYRGAIEELEEARLLDIFNTNVVGAMMLTGLAVPHLERTAGCVLFMGSSHTRRAFPGASPYAATKAAVQTLTQVLAAELGPRKIQVNCVIPGGVVTEINVRAGLLTSEQAVERQSAMASMQALERLGTGEDIAQAVEYFLTSKWVTGAILDVDGGLGLGVSQD